MQTIFISVATLINRHAKPVIASILVVTILFACGLSRLHLQMGNDSFVKPSSPIYQHTLIFQHHFGGDSYYILLKGKKELLISKETARAVRRFSTQALRMQHINGATSYVTVLDAILANGERGDTILDSRQLAATVLSFLNKKQEQTLQQEVFQQLSRQQKIKMEDKLLHLLTPRQILQIIHKLQNEQLIHQPRQSADQLAMVNGLLTDDQKHRLLHAAAALLSDRQRLSVQRQFVHALPGVRRMNSALLQRLIFSDHGRVVQPLRPLLPQNGRYALIVLQTSGNTDLSTDVKMSHEISQLIQKNGFDKRLSVKAAGPPAVLGQLVPLALKTIILVLCLSLALMLLILLFVFHVRRRLLSAGLVLIGNIWTFGLMGWCGVPITLATMAAMPVIIGLGTDFGVQLHNRYEEEYRKQADAALAVNQAIQHMGPAVGIAVFIMALSFLTLLYSEAPIMQQFGVTLAVGVVFCYLISLTLLFAILRLLDHKNKPLLSERSNYFIAARLNALTGSVGKAPIPILALAALLAVAGFYSEQSIPLETNFQKLIPQHLPALDQTNQLQRIAGSSIYLTYLISARDVTAPAALHAIEHFGRIEQNKHREIEAVTSLPALLTKLTPSVPEKYVSVASRMRQLPAPVRQKLLSGDHHFATVQFRVNQNLPAADLLRVMNQISSDRQAYAGIRAVPAGPEVMMLQGMDNIGAHHLLLIAAGLASSFIGLLVVYRRLKYAFYPLLPILFVLGYSPGTLQLLGLSYNPITITLSALVLGIGTEFTILIIERYREEKKRGIAATQAIKTAVCNVGQAIMVSGLTVIGGFSTLTMTGFPMLNAFGVITVLDTAYSLLSALIVLPALMFLFQSKQGVLQ